MVQIDQGSLTSRSRKKSNIVACYVIDLEVR